MKRYSVVIALSGALAVSATAWAGDTGATSALALPSLNTIALDSQKDMPLATAATVPMPEVAVVSGFAAPEAPSLAARTVILESVRWRPRRYRDRDRDRDRDEDRYVSRRSGSRGFSQLHAGFFDPDGEQEAGFIGGFRGGASVDNHVQLGVGIDWAYKASRATEVVTFVPLPGGGTSERRLELARSSSNLFPLMAFLQLSPGNENDVHPYFGIGGGYEVLFLSAEDFTTGDKFDATYSGWGWQGWAGVAIPLSGRNSINVEIFRNLAELDRDVQDPNGQTYNEVVDAHGVGMRFGLNWGF